jgi:uncharacterized membrane protein YfcA
MDISEQVSLLPYIVPLFFGISFIYSSVGFGGGSSYIAILVLFGISLFLVPPIALVLNIIVAGIAMINFAKAGHLSLKFALPFLSSVPFAFIAGTITIPTQQLTLIFVITLFAASAALFVSGMRRKNYHQKSSHIINTQIALTKKIILIGVPAGAAMGLVAGLVGIGGGIWLSPLLILGGLADSKRAAATASIFILTNSISGLVGQSFSRPIDLSFLLPLAIVVLAGGLIGSRYGARSFDNEKLRLIVAGIVATAGINLLVKLLTTKP